MKLQDLLLVFVKHNQGSTGYDAVKFLSSRGLKVDHQLVYKSLRTMAARGELRSEEVVTDENRASKRYWLAHEVDFVCDSLSLDVARTPFAMQVLANDISSGTDKFGELLVSASELGKEFDPS